MTKILIDEATGKEIKPGDVVKTHDGEEYFLTGFDRDPNRPWSTGRVYIRKGEFSQSYYPSVIGARIEFRD